MQNDSYTRSCMLCGSETWPVFLQSVLLLPTSLFIQPFSHGYSASSKWTRQHVQIFLVLLMKDDF